MAAAVILVPEAMVDGLADSKLLTPKRRETLFTVIGERAIATGIGRMDVEEIDRLNVYRAAMEAHRRAVEILPNILANVLVEGKCRIADCRLVQTPVINADACSASISAAATRRQGIG